jgi:hypothetical protein
VAPTIAAVGTFVPGNSATGTTDNFGAPSGIVVDSLLVALYTVEHNGSGTLLAAPSGWLKAPDSDGAFQAVANGTALYVFYRIATAADVGVTSYDMPVQSGRYRRGAILRIAGHDPGSPWDGGDGAVAASSTSAPSVSVTTTGPDRLLLWIGSSYNLSAWATLPTSFTEIAEFASTSEVNTAAQRDLASAATVTTGTIATGASAGKAAWIGAIRPASSGNTGSLLGTTPKATASLTGEVGTPGALTATTPKATATLEGGVGQAGTLAAIVPRPVGTFAGTVRATAAVAGTSPLPVAAVTGLVGHLAALSATAPKPTAAIDAAVRDTGALATTTPKATAALTGTAETPPVPGALLDLSYWHLTTPADSGEGDAEQIDQPELDSYESEFFFVETFQARQVVTCRAPVNGFTTSGASGATRTELRQRRKGTYALAAIDPHAAGRWQMTGTSYVDATSITGGSNPRKEGIFAQIHGAGDSPIPLILAAEYHVATPRVRVFKNGPSDPVNPNAVLGITPTTPISYRIRIENDRLKLWVIAGLHTDLPPVESTAHYDWPISDFTDDQDWYFKDGAYNKTLITSGSSGEFISRIAYLEVLEPSDPESAIPGTLSTTTPKATTALTGAVVDTGTLSAVVPLTAAVLTGDVVAGGTTSATSPVPTAALTGAVAAPGLLQGAAPVPDAALTGTVRATGALSATTPLPTGAIAATGDLSGPLSAVAPSPTAQLSGDVAAQGALSGAAPRASAQLSGDVAASGALSTATPLPTAAFSASTAVLGSLAALTPRPQAVLVGEEGPTGFIGAGPPRRVSEVQVGSLIHERGLQAGAPRKVVMAGAG